MKSQKEVRSRRTVDLAMRIIANGRSEIYKEASSLSNSISLSDDPEKVIQDFLFRKFNNERSVELANAKDASTVRETIFEWVTKFKIPGDVNPDELRDLLEEIDEDNCENVNHGICLRLNHRGSARNDRANTNWLENGNENKTIKFKES
ncbi:hypothetical protein L0156_05725 [bacterium]|nr:hypothetical protein [bacterium]